MIGIRTLLGRADEEATERILDHFPVLIDQQQIGNLDQAEMHAERVDPEMIGLFRIAGRDVSGHTLIEAVF